MDRRKPLLSTLKRKHSFAFRLIRGLLVAGLCFGLGAAAGLAAVFSYFSTTLPEVGLLLDAYAPPQTTRILAADGTVIGELFTERRTVVPLGRIPALMVDAVLAAEDADFRTHRGLDYPGMLRALWTNVSEGKLSQGASTITQQVARTFFLSREKTFARKIREILLTQKIEEQLTKDQILFLYLNQINFGQAHYGIEEAARYYFAKHVEALTLSEAALLAGIPKGPAIYSPVLKPEAALQRRTYVLGEMRKRNLITAAAADAANRSPIGIVPGGHRYDARLAPEAVGRVLFELQGIVSRQQLDSGGYTIETTLEPRWQRSARQVLREGLLAADKRHHRLAPFKAESGWPQGDRGLGALRVGKTYLAEVTGYDEKGGRILLSLGGRLASFALALAARYNPDALPVSLFAAKGAKLYVTLRAPEQKGTSLDVAPAEGPQAALTAVSPADGRILALVGGDDVEPRGFDRATAARRQPGSAFKPFLYLAAIETRRYTAATLLDDAPEVQGDWKPRNAHGDEFAGTVRLRDALARSLNTPAVKLIADVGPARVVEIAKLLGIDSPLDPTPSLALGTSAVSPLELCASFAVFAAGGKHMAPWIVKRVLDRKGKPLSLVGRAPRQVITVEAAALMTSLLTSVVEEGTATEARKLGRPSAGKTGTTDEQRDAWFVGYTPELAAAVWVGYDDYRPLGRGEYGAKAALPIWTAFMKTALADQPDEEFVRPAGLIEVLIDPLTGLLAYEGLQKPLKELFIEGTEPTAIATPPELVTPESFLMDQLSGVSPEAKSPEAAIKAAEPPP